MPSSPNIGVVHITQGQSQKEVTHSEGVDRIDRATHETHAFTGITGTVTPTTDEIQQAWRFLLQGSPGAGFNVDIPATIKKPAYWVNETGQTATIQVLGGGGASFAIPAGGSSFVYSDGTDVIELIAEKIVGRAFELVFFFPGVPGNLVRMVQWPIARSLSFPVNFAGSVGRIATNPTAITNLDVHKNGASVGTISISTGGVFTFTLAGGMSLVAGDRVEIFNQAVADATASDISVTLVGTTA